MKIRRTATRCTHTKADGTRCRATALPGKAKCVFHDRASAPKRSAGRRRGGINRCRRAAVLPPDTPDLPLATVEHVRAALADTFNRARRGEIGVALANCLGQLGGQLVRAIEGGVLEQRIAALENGVPLANPRRAA